MQTENRIDLSRNILIALSDGVLDKNPNFQYLTQHFCGAVVLDTALLSSDLAGKNIYFCGDIRQLPTQLNQPHIIRELSPNYDQYYNAATMRLVGLGAVPVSVHGAGVYFRCLFEEDTDYFNEIKSAHVFQDLTESTKPSKALRKGIYLTEIRRENHAEQGELLHYRLLRCSSNLSGATDNFRAIDHRVMKAINEAANAVFEQPVALNHVLAQIYENSKKADDQAKEHKAKIKAHSDKTKDMPPEALIAFCTFYDKNNLQSLQVSASDPYDYCYRNLSGLTRLHFKLKNSVQDDALVKEFSVTLYPNSVFFIPLSTNRLYTHEIKPSVLSIDKIPVRMGYVARCSNAEAVFMNNQTYLKHADGLVKLAQMQLPAMQELRETYREENVSEKVVRYGDVDFSMNTGDYLKPIY